MFKKCRVDKNQNSIFTLHEGNQHISGEFSLDGIY